MSSVRIGKEVTGVLRAVCLIFTTPQNCLIFALFFTVALLYDRYICLIFFGQGWEFIIKEKKKVNKKVTTHTSTKKRTRPRKYKKKDSSCFYSSDRQIIQSC